MAALTIDLDSKGINEIKIDNDGDGVEDIIFQFRFHQRPAQPDG
jgi:hypothetical protein